MPESAARLAREIVAFENEVHLHVQSGTVRLAPLAQGGSFSCRRPNPMIKRTPTRHGLIAIQYGKLTIVNQMQTQRGMHRLILGTFH